MAKTKITAPTPGYNGTGPGRLTFKDGVAYTDDASLIRYFQRRGYGIDGEPPTVAAVTEQPIDARDATGVQVGTALRDAAVDPRAGDFLPPTNAGAADPHGPLVVAPGVHAGASSPLVPGVVSGDIREQEQRETQAAVTVLVDNEPHSVLGDPDGSRGPLGLSDPGSAEVGAQAAAADEPADGAVMPAASAVEMPSKAAKVDEWREYARALARDDVALEAIDSMTKAELIDTYGTA